MAGKRVVIVATSHDKLGNTEDKTGLWLEELAAPYHVWKNAGAEITVASIKGGKIPIDPTSLQGDYKTEDVERFLGDTESKKSIEESIAVKDVTGEYDVVFVPGGHGIIYDGPDNPDLIKLLEKHAAADKVICSVCHGPAALVNVKRPDGDWLVKDKRVSAFTNSEEEAVGKTKVVPFLLEDKLKERGAKFERGPDWHPHVAKDGKLVTGQNPQSSAPMAKAVLEVLQ